MEEQTRGPQQPRGGGSGGIRRFMQDPKTSVMSYLAENLPQDHSQHPPGYDTHIPQQTASTYGQQYTAQGSGGAQNPNHANSSQTSLPQSQYSSHIPLITPFVPSNAGISTGSYAGTHSGQPQSQAGYSPPSGQQGSIHEQAQDQFGQSQTASSVMTSLGKLPPMTATKHNSAPQSASRVYNRMTLDFEMIKNAFFIAKSQHNTHDMASAAYELESQSRKIWSFRFEHSWEFEGYSESAHQAVITDCQAQYELWADTVLDIEDEALLALRGASMGGDSSTTGPLSGQRSYGQSQPNKYPQGQSPQPPQQPSELQNLPLDQNNSLGQSTQSTQPPQYMSPNIPGQFSSGGGPPPMQSPGQQPVPLQQQSQSPPPPQLKNGQPSIGPGATIQASMGPGQTGSTTGLGGHGGPPNMGAWQQNGQGMPPGSPSNVQQGRPQQMPLQGQSMPPQQRLPSGQQIHPQQGQQLPPQQGSPQGQQMQGGQQPNMQQGPHINQRPPGQPANSMPPLGQMGPGQGQPSRPDFQNLPPNLQTGGR